MTIYLCPTDKKYHCSWEGHSEDILDHFEKEHDDLLHYNEYFNVDLGTPTENRLFFIDGEIYLTQIYIEETKLILKLRYLGLEKYARKINYNIKLKVNNQQCQPEFTRITPNGFLEIDLVGLSNIHKDFQFLTCVLNITKEFTDEDSVESVFVDELLQASGEQQADEIIQTAQNDNNEFNEKEDETNDLERTCDEYRTKERQKLDNEEKKVKTKENNEVNTHVQETANERRKTVQEDVDFRSIQHDIPEVSSLSRSKSTAFEDMRRNWYKVKNTLSLGSIQEMDNSVTCTNCSTCLKSPIYICPTGHHFCEKCQPGLCSMCEKKITFVRDTDLEKIINKFSLSPCQFQKLGCPEKLLQNDLHQHEVNCSFCLYKCPMGECHFEAQYKGLCKHLKLIHSSTKLLSSFILSFNNYPTAFLASEEKGVFHCYVQYGTEDVEWTAEFCGPKERNFFCELKFKDGKVKEPVLLK